MNSEGVCEYCFALGCNSCYAGNSLSCFLCSDPVAVSVNGLCTCPDGMKINSLGFCEYCNVKGCGSCEINSPDVCSWC